MEKLKVFIVINDSAGFLLPYKSGDKTRVVYSLTVDGDFTSEGIRVVADSMFHKFNAEHPKDYKERSLSIGDIVVIMSEFDAAALVCDLVGWTEVIPICPEWIEDRSEEKVQ